MRASVAVTPAAAVVLSTLHIPTHIDRIVVEYILVEGALDIPREDMASGVWKYTMTAEYTEDGESMYMALHRRKTLRVCIGTKKFELSKSVVIKSPSAPITVFSTNRDTDPHTERGCPKFELCVYLSYNPGPNRTIMTIMMAANRRSSKLGLVSLTASASKEPSPSSVSASPSSPAYTSFEDQTSALLRMGVPLDDTPPEATSPVPSPPPPSSRPTWAGSASKGRPTNAGRTHSVALTNKVSPPGKALPVAASLRRL
jgi:hypothetical protein